MSSILPLRSEPKTGKQDPRVVDLDGEDADAVFSALSSSTARRIVASLHDEPKAQSEIADAIDTSVQNVRYHLDKLEDAGLVEVVDTWYSSRGNEMKVYAPADGALIVSGDEGTAARLKNALQRLVGGITVIAMASLFVQMLATGPVLPSISLGSSGSGEAPEDFDAGGAGGDGGDGGSGGGDAGDVEPTINTSGESASGYNLNETQADTSAGSDGGEDGSGGGGDGGGQTTTESAGNGDATQTTDVTATDPGTTETYTRTTQTTPTEPTTTVSTDGGAPDTTVETVTTATTDVATTTIESMRSVDEAATAAGLPPGLAFFLGGVSVLVVVVALWYWAG